MRVRWTQPAARDLAHICDFIQEGANDATARRARMCMSSRRCRPGDIFDFSPYFSHFYDPRSQEVADLRDQRYMEEGGEEKKARQARPPQGHSHGLHGHLNGLQGSGGGRNEGAVERGGGRGRERAKVVLNRAQEFARQRMVRAVA